LFRDAKAKLAENKRSQAIDRTSWPWQMPALSKSPNNHKMKDEDESHAYRKKNERKT